MKIATWNINGVRARMPQLLVWLKEASCDVVLLQEIKCMNDKFPGEEIEDLGYNLAIHGQKSFNGVAILAKRPIEDVEAGLPGDESDEQARYIEATVGGVRVGSIYLPNGNPVETDKYTYKLKWMGRLREHIAALLDLEECFVLGGDYNVCSDDRDVYDPAGWAEDALCRPETRRHFREILYSGVTEAYRALHPETIAYTFWDYQAGAWQKDHGLRIDHLLLSPQAADRLEACEIDRVVRGREKASDHVPIWCELNE